MQPLILIAGATGATGKVATRQLLEQGFPVRALAHKVDDRSQALAQAGAELFVGDLLDFRAVRRAFEGVQRAYFVYPMRPGLMQATAQFAQAAREAGAEFIVNMSQRTAVADAASDSALQHWLGERVFDWSGVAVTHLRPTIFCEWMFYMRNMLREGRMSFPFERSGRFAPVAATDLGTAVARILANPAAHTGQTYPLFGPTEITAPEWADIVSQVLGKPVRYEKITGEQWVNEVAGQAIPFLAQHIQAIAEAQQHGQMAGMGHHLEKIIGRPPVSLAQFVEQHRAVFQ